MERVEELQPGIIQQEDALRVVLDKPGDNANNVLDKVIFHIILDAKKNDEPLRMLPKPLFDSAEIERLNVDDSIILDLMYKNQA